MSEPRRTPIAELARRLQTFTGAALKDYPKGDRRARIVAVAAQKGGVGKTTSAVHLAWALAQDPSRKVLLVDLDPQGHVAASLRGLIAGRRGSLSDVLLARDQELLDLAQPARDSLLELVLSDKRLAETEGILSSKIGKEFHLRRTLERTKTHYDWIILDCPPHLGELTLNALVAADEVIVPTQLSALAFEGVHDLLDALAKVGEHMNPNLGVLGILLTQVDSRTPAANLAVRRQIESTFGPVVLKTEIPINSAVRQAQMEGLPLFRFAPKASAALAYERLAAEVSGREAEEHWAP